MQQCACGPQGSARPTEVDIEKTMPHTQRSMNRHPARRTARASHGNV